MGFEVCEDMIVGPDGQITYSVLEDHEDLAAHNFQTKQHTDGWTPERSMRKICAVPARLYQLWESRFPGCWNDRNFVRSFMREHPEYASADIRKV